MPEPLSVDAVHDTVAPTHAVAVAVTSVGTVGGVVSTFDGVVALATVE